jgi:hypothetical protein
MTARTSPDGQTDRDATHAAVFCALVLRGGMLNKQTPRTLRPTNHARDGTKQTCQ